MRTIKPSTLLPQCCAVGGVLLRLSVLPLEQKLHSTILMGPSTRASKKSMIHVDVATAKVTTTTCCNKATPALEHSAAVDGAKDKDTPTLMQLKCPPEVAMQQNPPTEVIQTLSQLVWYTCGWAKNS
jgi:hypothetical protein